MPGEDLLGYPAIASRPLPTDSIRPARAAEIAKEYLDVEAGRAFVQASSQVDESLLGGVSEVGISEWIPVLDEKRSEFALARTSPPQKPLA
jgi:hypothetical protein